MVSDGVFSYFMRRSRMLVMVRTATSLGRSGLQDWIIQRITAIILAIYTAFLFGYFIINSDFSYEAWRILFTFPWMRCASVLALFSLITHAWVGIWTITTDYIKPIGLRLLVQVMVVIILLIDLVWGIHIIWGI